MGWRWLGSWERWLAAPMGGDCPGGSGRRRLAHDHHIEQLVGELPNVAEPRRRLVGPRILPASLHMARRAISLTVFEIDVLVVSDALVCDCHIGGNLTLLLDVDAKYIMLSAGKGSYASERCIDTCSTC